MQFSLTAQNIRFIWPKGGFGLELDDFCLAQGEKLLLLGPSGSGKSTLLSLLAGISLPQDGQIIVTGQDLAALGQAARDRHRANHIGMIFQNLNLVPYLDALQNVALPLHFAPLRRARVGLPQSQAEAQALLSRLGLAVQDYSGKAASSLSIGQQQRVAAARALIGAPSIVIADEPTSALDSANRATFMRVLGDELQRSQASLLMVSHDESLRPFFDRSLNMAQISRLLQVPA